MKQEIKERIEQIKNGQVPSGYKQTPVGVCPIDWEYKKLKKLIKIKHGQPQHRIETIDGIYPILATGGIIGRTNDFLCNKESVLIGRKGTINKPQYMDSPFWTVDTLFYTNILENNLAKYIYYLFLTINWKRYDESTGVPSLSAKGIENIKTIYTTNINEQKNIANVLTTWDNAVELQENKIKKLQEKKKALMQKLLTPKSDWNNYVMSELILKEEKTNLQSSQGLASGLYPFYINNSSESTKYSNTYLFDGEYLIANTGGQAYFSYIKGKFTAMSDCFVFSIKEQDAKFVYYVLQNQIEKINLLGFTGSGLKHLDKNWFYKLKLFLPGNKIQQNIAKILSAFDKKIDLENQLLEKYKEQRKALMQLLLTGIVRV